MLLIALNKGDFSIFGGKYERKIKWHCSKGNFGFARG